MTFPIHGTIKFMFQTTNQHTDPVMEVSIVGYRGYPFIAGWFIWGKIGSKMDENWGYRVPPLMEIPKSPWKIHVQHQKPSVNSCWVRDGTDPSCHLLGLIVRPLDHFPFHVEGMPATLRIFPHFGLESPGTGPCLKLYLGAAKNSTWC